MMIRLNIKLSMRELRNQSKKSNNPYLRICNSSLRQFKLRFMMI